MLVSALVLTTGPDFGEAARSALEAEPALTLGPADGAYLPAVTTTHDLRAARDLAEWLAQVTGVRDVQLLSWVDEDASDEEAD
jgi:hypothetical protein